jgi:DNA-binding GntR family transcriptional regulator
VLTVDEFDAVRDGDILVCQMTNPAWVVLFTKIAALVTDTGGTTSHPAVLSREFGIPAVIGTSTATHTIRPATGSASTARTASVEILAKPPAAVMPRPWPTLRASRAQRPRRPGQGRLLEEILPAAIAPDARIVETQVARELGTSQAPVREALRGLRRSGRARSPRSAAPRPPSHPRELLEAYAVRSALEVRWPPLGGAAHADDDDWRELAEHSNACSGGPGGDGTRSPRPTPASTAGSSSSADNGTLEQVWRSLEPFSRTYLTLVVRAPTRSGRPTCTRPILAALQARTRGRWSHALRRTLRTTSRPTWPGACRPTDDPSRRSRPRPSSSRSSRGPGAAARRRPRARSVEHVLEDMNFLNYRLARCASRPTSACRRPDLVWHQDGDQSVATTAHG